MTSLDWTLVLLLNGCIVLYAILGSRRTESSEEWFLGGRSVPWWIVGISAFATAVDSSDLVADSGGVYSLGISYFVTNWIGTVSGWLLLAHFVALPMYRSGMYTNSEYLEKRFGVTARVCSSLVQVQYRTMVMANISTTLYLVFTVVGGLGVEAWAGVVAVVLLSLSYTILGGSRSVAIADSVQSIVMISASLVLFAFVWNAVGGWSGLNTRLASADERLPAQMLRIGTDLEETVSLKDAPEQQIQRQMLLGGTFDSQSQTWIRRTPAWLICLSFVLVGMAYSIVNHEQSMRLFAARSIWDMKMSVVVASLLLIILTFFNLMMGVMGRALFPTHADMPVTESLQGTADAIYPVLVRDFTVSGLRGVVVAGVLAAAISTYSGIGAAMSALLTRDVYSRLLVKEASDHHYVVAGRWLTVAIVFGSFCYVPFLLARGMMMFYLDLVGAFVMPLLTIYLMGIFTGVHRASGTIGLLTGVAYGVCRLVCTKLASDYGIATLPPVFLDSFVSYPVSVLLTASTMILVSIVLGWGTQTEDSSPVAAESEAAPELPLGHGMEQPRETVVEEGSPWLPQILGVAVLGLGIVLSFVVFW
ncbi:sodium:solute symporter family transporter [Planctomicrobium sp. SH661]|uniref:sodium:solute symporter family transporter n=1 Tax=Planctomicrobium sp. SH661 TaxID=3448124 RepID=UPI003F5B81AF